MNMAYQYTNKQQRTANFLKFDENEQKELVVNEWDYTKHSSGYLFRCYVEEENGEKVDKIWTVWDYQSTQLLKKKLGSKCLQPKRLKVKMTVNDEDEQEFEISS